MANINKMIDMVNQLVQKSSTTLSIIVSQKQAAVMDGIEAPSYLEQIYSIET